MSFNTSIVVFESRFPVGSSAKMICGFIARALAIPTRCCCPPDIWFGMWVMNFSSPTSLKYCFARLILAALGIPRNDNGSATFSTASIVPIRL